MCQKVVVGVTVAIFFSTFYLTETALKIPLPIHHCVLLPPLLRIKLQACANVFVVHSSETFDVPHMEKTTTESQSCYGGNLNTVVGNY